MATPLAEVTWYGYPQCYSLDLSKKFVLMPSTWTSTLVVREFWKDFRKETHLYGTENNLVFVGSKKEAGVE
jgi:hypothetical protein